MDETKIIEVEKIVDGVLKVEKIEPRMPLKIEQEGRTLYLFNGFDTDLKVESLHLFEKTKDGKMMNINLDKYIPSECVQLKKFFEDKKAVNVKFDELPDKIQTYDKNYPLEDVLNGTHLLPLEEKPSSKYGPLKILSLNDAGKITKLEAIINGKAYVFSSEDLINDAINEYAKQIGKEPEEVIETLKKEYKGEEKIEPEEEKESSKKPAWVKALAVGTALTLIGVGAYHIGKNSQQGNVVTTRHYITDTTQTPKKAPATNTTQTPKKAPATNTPEIVDNSQEHDVNYVYDAKYQKCFNNISDWLNNKSSVIKGEPHSGYEANFNDVVDDSVLSAFDVLRSNIIMYSYAQNSRSSTQNAVNKFCNIFMSFVYENANVFDDDTLLYSNMSIEAKRELIEMGLDVFSMDLNKTYNINGKSVNYDKAFEMINKTYDQLYADEYGTRNR